MAGWVALITALACSGALIIRSALEYQVAKWSLKADEDGRRHARKLLKVLQNDRHRTVDRLRAAAHAVSTKKRRVR